jgi:hypothetical protein
MPLAMSCETCLQCWLVSVLGAILHPWCACFHLFLLDSLLLHSSRRCCKVADCGMIDGTMRNHVVQLGVPICRTAAP